MIKGMNDWINKWSSEQVSERANTLDYTITTSNACLRSVDRFNCIYMSGKFTLRLMQAACHLPVRPHAGWWGGAPRLLTNMTSPCEGSFESPLPYKTAKMNFFFFFFEMDRLFLMWLSKGKIRNVSWISVTAVFEKFPPLQLVTRSLCHVLTRHDVNFYTFKVIP